jgi:hypothetical protein
MEKWLNLNLSERQHQEEKKTNRNKKAKKVIKGFDFGTIFDFGVRHCQNVESCCFKALRVYY